MTEFQDDIQNPGVIQDKEAAKGPYGQPSKEEFMQLSDAGLKQFATEFSKVALASVQR